MANEFIIKNGFISKGDGVINGGLNISTIGGGTPQINLGLDSSGNVVTGTTTIDTNIANTNLTLNGSRFHDLNGFDLTIAGGNAGIYLDESTNTSQLGQGSNYIDINNTSITHFWGLGNRLSMIAGETVINEPGSNIDLRVESDTNPNMLFVDGGTNRVGIGTNLPSETLDVNGNTKISGSLNIGTVLGNTPIINLGLDSSGNVVTGTTGGGTFTGNTSGDCITDLYVTNLYGCSPITVNDSIQSVTSSATGTTSFAFGFQTKAHGNYSHAEGSQTTASGYVSHAEGGRTTASGYVSHAEGVSTIASGNTSHAEGFESKAHGDYSHAEGYQSIASGDRAHAEGEFTTASGRGSHAEGGNTTATSRDSHAEGQQTTASGDGSHAEGIGTTASGYAAHAEGNSTIASGDNSHAQNGGCQSIGSNSFAGGDTSVASGATSFVFSTNSTVSGRNSAILGGRNLTGTEDDFVYVPSLEINGEVRELGGSNLSGDGTLTISGGVSTIGVRINGTNNVTLPNGTSGQKITIYVQQNTGVNTTIGGTFLGYSSVKLAAVGESVQLLYTSSGGWVVIGGNNFVAT